MRLTLVGSKLEDEYRQQIESSLRALKRGGELAFLRSLLEAQNINPDHCAVIKYLPEQGEDIYTLLGYPDQVVVIEFERGKPETAFVDSRSSLKEYLHRKSKAKQIKVLVALDVIKTVVS